jgi:hypothetical protein
LDAKREDNHDQNPPNLENWQKNPNVKKGRRREAKKLELDNLNLHYIKNFFWGISQVCMYQ